MTRSCTTGGGSIGRRSAARVVFTSTVSCFPHFPFYRHRRHNPYHIVHPTIIQKNKPPKKKKEEKKIISSAPNPNTKKKKQRQKRKQSQKNTHTFRPDAAHPRLLRLLAHRQLVLPVLPHRAVSSRSRRRSDHPGFNHREAKARETRGTPGPGRGRGLRVFVVQPDVRQRGLIDFLC